MSRRILLVAACMATTILITARTAAQVEDFAFVHISDTHVSPHIARTGPPGALRGAESIAWICEQAVGPQKIRPLKITTPAPAFAIATGDLTEYGVIDDTWEQFENAFASLPYPLYVTPGNHDNTWVAMYHVMRERHGGVNYSFDQFGCHFVCINSASPQEPVPTIDATTRRWLRRDLDQLKPGTPVFVALHHPPYSREFARAEYDTFIDLLRNYNVVLLLYGHGHSVNHRNMDGIDGVMGGSTYGKNAGYSVISVTDGVLRVAHRYHRKPTKNKEKTGSAGWKVLLEKPLRSKKQKRLFSIWLSCPPITDPDVMGITLRRPKGHADADLVDIQMWIDNQIVDTEPLDADRQPSRLLRIGELTPGCHLLTVRAKAPDGSSDLRTFEFMTARHAQARNPLDLSSAVKAGPVIVSERLFVADSKKVTATFARGRYGSHWTFKTGGEILGTPAWSGELLVFGSGDGKVYALDADGNEVWTFDAGLPVYGPPLIDAGTVYIGDNGGRLHALNLSDGSLHWTFKRADYSIECRPCVWDSLIVFGAWDGYLYALNRTDGSLAWKALGPKSSEGKAARYYAPADCGPVALGDTLFVCDRGYILATYDREGKLGQRLDEATAAIAADPRGRHLYARGRDNRVCKYDVNGKKLWETAVPAGRFPVPPTSTNDSVYVCSNTGLLSVLDAQDGSIRWQFQVTPGFYVMAPVTVDNEGACYVASMDGTVAALRPPKSQP